MIKTGRQQRKNSWNNCVPRMPASRVSWKAMIPFSPRIFKILWHLVKSNQELQKNLAVKLFVRNKVDHHRFNYFVLFIVKLNANQTQWTSQGLTNTRSDEKLHRLDHILFRRTFWYQFWKFRTCKCSENFEFESIAWSRRKQKVEKLPLRKRSRRQL